MYLPAKKEDWFIGTTDNANTHWRHFVKFIDLSSGQVPDAKSAILGFKCDEGVKRNNGRLGALNGPDEFRKQMGKMAWHLEPNTIIDAGNVVCNDNDLITVQKEYTKAVSQLLKFKIFPIGVGGGHEIAIASYRGIRDRIGDEKLAILNFDAHFDMRNAEPNSGTSFLQIAKDCKEKTMDFGYYCLGINSFANSRQLFKTAEEYRAHYKTWKEIEFSPAEKTILEIENFIKDFDHVYVSICMDVFNQAVAPGVSAPNPAGFKLKTILPLLKTVFESGKVILVDLAELNPEYDTDDQTSRLVAFIVYYITETIMEANYGKKPT